MRVLTWHPRPSPEPRAVARALYAYPSEHLPFWETVRAQARVAAWSQPVPPGALGEDLRLQGLVEERLWVGDRLRLPNATWVVTAPRWPCAGVARGLGFAAAPALMRQSGFCGVFLAVVEDGPVAAGDPIRLEPGPRELNLREWFRSRAAEAACRPGGRGGGTPSGTAAA